VESVTYLKHFPLNAWSYNLKLWVYCLFPLELPFADKTFSPSEYNCHLAFLILASAVNSLLWYLIVYKNIFVGFEVIMAVGTKMAVFWVVAPCSLVEIYHSFRGDDRLDDGGSKDLWNVGKFLPDYTVLQSRRQPSSVTSLFLLDFGSKAWEGITCKI
jgi:hypothetical protein